MKVHLMFRDRDFDRTAAPLPLEPALVQDLALETLFAAMARGDKFLSETVPRGVLTAGLGVHAIRYRQDVLKDCVGHSTLVRQIYELAVETIELERKNYMGRSIHHPSFTLRRSIEVLEMMSGQLRRLRAIADRHAPLFRSEGCRTLFAMLQRELDDAYLALIADHLKRLRFPRGVLISAELGHGNKGVGYVLRKPHPPQGTWLERLFASGPPSHSWTLPERDQAGATAMSELNDRGINLVANALMQSAEHVLSFFQILRAELAFYVGSLNLLETLRAFNAPTSLPDPADSSERLRTATGLYDVCLALTLGRQIVGNDIAADGKTLIIVTGANTGGKSTFLRSVGLAQVMMQCGMFVAADRYRANLCNGLFTHYKREEDTTMSSGKFDEELSRMTAIVDQLRPDALVLFNESFAATNEREGSDIARQITTALLEASVEVVFVTHQYEFANDFHAAHPHWAYFLRAERGEGGTRTFKLVERGPLPTSYGEDLYREIFEASSRHKAVVAAL